MPEPISIPEVRARRGWLVRHGRPARRGGHLLRRAALASLVLLLMVSSEFTFGKKDEPSKDARINLIRGFVSEIAVTKVTLPRGKHGVFVDATGKLEKAEADKELYMNGAAINPGTPVAITKITFKPRRIVLELNGGGKKRKKWYQRIEIGMGGTTQPIVQDAPVLTYGSWISLRFKGDTPDLTVEQAKSLLAGVLDFTRHSPTVLYSPVIPPEFKEAIKKHEVLVGMDRDAVLSSKGPPERKVREDRPDGTQEEDWIYGLPPHVLYVIFEGDSVVRVQQY